MAIDWLNAAIALVGATIFVTHVTRTGPRPKFDIPGTLVVARVLLIGFVVWQRKAAHLLLPLAIVLDRNRAAAYISLLEYPRGHRGDQLCRR